MRQPVFFFRNSGDNEVVNSFADTQYNAMSSEFVDATTRIDSLPKDPTIAQVTQTTGSST